MAPGWIDISVPIRNGMVRWPGDPAVRIERLREIKGGYHANVSAMVMGSHTGTHMDGPVHFLPRAKGIDSVPFPAIIGRARVIEIKDPEVIRPEELRPHRIRRGERVLLKTRNSGRAWRASRFIRDFVALSNEAAQFLRKRRVQTVGIDYLSVGRFQRDGTETHRTLLQAGIWIIEGLDLSRVRPGPYELICLPLRIAGGDGAPARALLKPVPSGPK
jgi:arylformamidase